MASSAYLRLLIFLPAILISACASSSPAFLMMYFAYKLNKKGDNIQPWCPPFPILNQPAISCPVLTVASWPVYRFPRRQVGVVQYYHLFKNFPQCVVIHTVKGFSVVNEAEVDVSLEFYCCFYDPMVAHMVKRLPAMRQTRVWFLGREDPLEEEMAIHSCLENYTDGGAW